MRPSFQINGRRQSGHHKRLAAGAPLRVPESHGAQTATTSAVSNTGIDQTRKLNRQLAWTSGSTSGMVRAAARISPIKSPVV